MKYLFPLFLALVFLGSCKKTASNSCGYTASTVVAPAAEQQALQDSLTAHGLTATLAPSGFYYTINTPGAGASPKGPCSEVAVFYRAGFFNGKGFDSTSSGNPAVYELGELIPGWQKALPLIAVNGNITMYIPPSLAYGSRTITDSIGTVIIPPNSDLVFQLKLVDVQ